MSLSAQATEIAAAVEAACDLELVYPAPPARVEAFTAVVSPAPEWGTFEGTTFCDADVSWEVILIAGMADFLASMDWFYARVTELAASADVGVESWSQPERINLGSSEGLAVRVRLHPRSLSTEA